VNWTLEVVVVPVSDVDRAKAFYAERIGFNVDHDTIRPGYTDSDMWSGLSDAGRDGLRRLVADAMPVPGHRRARDLEGVKRQAAAEVAC
jgi:catechol 2,3-dioxygenase-like lactoylglutathione lyase family enzyme